LSTESQTDGESTVGDWSGSRSGQNANTTMPTPFGHSLLADAGFSELGRPFSP